MDWNTKVDLVKLGNNSYKTPLAKKEFQKFVLLNIKSFDLQAWEMFILLSNIVIDDMEDSVDYWKQIYRHINELNIDSFDFKISFRIGLIKNICENDLKIN